MLRLVQTLNSCKEMENISEGLINIFNLFAGAVCALAGCLPPLKSEPPLHRPLGLGRYVWDPRLEDAVRAANFDDLVPK